MYACSKCKNISTTKYEYLGHCDSHSTSSKKFYPCPNPQCSVSFRNRKSFYKHMDLHDKDEPIEKEPEILCRHCKVSFSSIEEIETHLKSLGAGVKIPCPHCKWPPFRTLIAYRVHKHR